MTRAQRIEQAARELLDGIQSSGTYPYLLRRYPRISADHLASLRAALALPEEESEVAALRAEVERLTRESADRLEAIATATEIAQELDRRYVAARAHAERLAGALREIYCGDPDCTSDACPPAREALKEWEEANK